MIAIPSAADLRSRYGGNWYEAGPNRSAEWAGLFAVDLVCYNNPMSPYRFGASMRVDQKAVAVSNGMTWQETLDGLFQSFHRKISILPTGRAENAA